MNQELSTFAAGLRETIQGKDAALQRPDSAARCPYQELGFNSLGLELFALQFAHNAAYREICKARKRTPQTVEHWAQIPAVPTGVFKELELSCIPSKERTAVFWSSGTTEQTPSRHFHNRESLEIYKASLWSWFTRHVVPEFGIRNSEFQILILTPPPEQVPHSSLVHMFETIRRKLGAPESVFAGKFAAEGTWTLNFNGVVAALKSAIGNRQSAILFGTAFSFVHLLDFLAENDLSFRLPPGSCVMETGGYKNRSRTMPKSELHALITERLGIPRENIICEYGMSELSSQAYGVTSDKRQVTRNNASFCHLSPVTCHFHFPPWARAQIISPENGREVADGETGLIRVFDLANIFSVMAIQTEDLGIRCGNGFELIGRAQSAEQRGCSLMSV